MKLYLIVYVAGKVIGFTGPLPYDMAECQRRATIEQRSCVNGAFQCADIRYRCEWAQGRPAIDPGFIN